MADDEMHAVAEKVVGDRHALARVAGVVADLEVDLLAHDAARRIDVGDSLLGAVLELGAESGVGPRHRPGDADLELGRTAVAAYEENAQGNRDCCQCRSFHGGYLVITFSVGSMG